MSHFMGVGIVWIGLSPTDLGCWRLTLNTRVVSKLTLDLYLQSFKAFRVVLSWDSLLYLCSVKNLLSKFFCVI